MTESQAYASGDTRTAGLMAQIEDLEAELSETLGELVETQAACETLRFRIDEVYRLEDKVTCLQDEISELLAVIPDHLLPISDRS